MTIPAPRPINHVGVGVSDIDAAIAWYGEILGYRLIAGPLTLDAQKDRTGRLADILGPAARRLRVAHLSTGGGPGIELFEAQDPPHERQDETVPFHRSGPFHLCVTDPDVEGLANRIAASGGRQRSQIWYTRAPSREYAMTYCQDPFGVIIEIHSHPYEMVQMDIKAALNLERP